jgi:hypothetical protein
MYLRFPGQVVSEQMAELGRVRAFDDVDELIDTGVFPKKHVGVVYAVP